MVTDPLFLLGFTISIVFLSVIIQKYFYHSVESKTRKSQIPPTSLPPGKTGWPIIGETLEYLSRPEQFIRDRITKYSPEIFKTSVLGEKVIVLCGSSGNKFLFSNETKLFTFWMPPSLASALSIDIHTSSPTSKLVDEQLHKFLRLESMQHLVPIMNSIALEHLQARWAPFDEVKVHPLSKEFTFGLSCRLLLNCRALEMVKEFTESFFLLHEKTMSKSVSLPFYKARRAKQVINKLVAMIRQRKMELPEKGDEEACHDLLGRVLISSREKEVAVNYEEIAGKINSLLFASFYTLSTTITFLLGHLAKYPNIYANVLKEQMEIAETKEKSETLSWKDIQKMKYSWNVVCESMRLKPPALGSYREAITDFTYATYKIPKGWKVHWNVYSTHKDPKYFPDPEVFDPSRFEGNKLPPFAFVPFGGGPMMCGGKEYARIEILIFLHHVITRFKLWTVNPNEKIIYSPVPTPVDGLRVRIQPRKE